ncbi:MAG: hypothetical protein PVI75_06000 [Gammaproteobacteria bacterium]|jgi:hypothetical protein
MSYKDGNGNKNKKQSDVSNQSFNLTPDDDLDSSFVLDGIGDDNVQDLSKLPNILEKLNSKEKKNEKEEKKNIPSKKTWESLQQFSDLIEHLCKEFIESCKCGDEFLNFAKKYPVFNDYRKFWNELTKKDNKKISDAKMKIILRATEQCCLSLRSNKRGFKPLKRLIYVLFQTGLSLCLNKSIKKIQKEIISNIGRNLYKGLLSYVEELYCFPPDSKYFVINNKKIIECKKTFKSPNVKNKKDIFKYLNTDIRTLISHGKFAQAYNLYYIACLFYTDSGYTGNFVRSELKLKMAQLNLFQSIERLQSKTKHLQSKIKHMQLKSMTIYRIDKKFFVMSLNNLISACKEIFWYGEGCLKNPTEPNWGNYWKFVFDDIFELSIVCAYLFAHLCIKNQRDAANRFSKLLSILSKLMDHKFFTVNEMGEYRKKYSVTKNLYNMRIMDQGKCDAETKYKALVVCIDSLPRFLSLYYNANIWGVIEENQVIKNDLNFSGQDKKNILIWFESKEVRCFVDYLTKEAINFCDANSFLKKISFDKLSLLFKIACKYYNFPRSEKDKIVKPLVDRKKSNDLLNTKIKSLHLHRGKNKDKYNIELVSPIKLSNKKPSGNFDQQSLGEIFNFSKSGERAAKLLSLAVYNHMQMLVKNQLKMIGEIGHTYISYNDFWSGIHLYRNTVLEVSKVIDVIKNKNKKKHGIDFKILLKSACYLELHRLIHVNFLKKISEIILAEHKYLCKFISKKVFQVDSFEKVGDDSYLISRLRALKSEGVFEKFQSIEQEIFCSKTKDAISQVIALWQIFHLFCADNNCSLRVKALTKIAILQMEKSCIIQKKNRNNGKKIKKKDILSPKELKCSILALIKACRIADDNNAKRVFKQIMILNYSLQQCNSEFNLQELYENAKKISESSTEVCGEKLDLKFAFVKNELRQKVKFLIFCFQDESELLDILYTYQFPSCQFAQLFLEYSIDVCVEYFCKLDVRSFLKYTGRYVEYFCEADKKNFLPDERIYFAALRIFNVAVSLYCGKDLGKNKYNLRMRIAQNAVRKVKEDLQKRINGFIEKICNNFNKELKDGILKVLEKLKESDKRKTTWGNVRCGVENIWEIIWADVIKDNCEKYFPDDKAQLSCIIREIKKAIGIPKKNKKQLIDTIKEVRKYTDIQEEKSLTKEQLINAIKKIRETIDVSEEQKLLTKEQIQKIIAKIKQIFCPSSAPTQQLPQKPKGKNKQQKNVIVIRQEIGFRSYIKERLNRCNPFGPLYHYVYHFVDGCNAKSVKFGKSFNKIILNSDQSEFSRIPTKKYTKKECEKVLEARFVVGELTLHYFLASFSSNLFLVGKLLPEFKIWAVYYQVGSWYPFLTQRGGSTFRGEIKYPCEDGTLSFSSWEKYISKKNCLIKSNHKQTENYINATINNANSAQEQAEDIIKMLLDAGILFTRISYDPRFKMVLIFAKNNCGYFTVSKAFELFLLRSFFPDQPKTIGKIDLDTKKHNKNNDYYRLLYKFIRTRIYAGGALWHLAQLLITQGKQWLRTNVDRNVKIALANFAIANALKNFAIDVEMIDKILYVRQCLHKKEKTGMGNDLALVFHCIAGFICPPKMIQAYLKDVGNGYRNVLYYVCEQIITQASERAKKMPMKFSHQLVAGVCTVIEHKNFMGMRLNEKLRTIVDDFLMRKIQIFSCDAYKKITSCKVVEDLKQSPENSTKLSEHSRNDYLVNMQMLFLEFDKYACARMPCIFIDLIKMHLRRLHLERALKTPNRAKYDIPLLPKYNFLITKGQDSFIKSFKNKVNLHIKDIKILLQKHNDQKIAGMLKKIEKYVDCFEQRWFWDEAGKIFSDYQDGKNNKENFYKCIFCIVTFLQDEKLKGFPKKSTHGKSTDIFEEGIKRIDSLLSKRKLENLKPYLRFILNEGPLKAIESNIFNEDKFAAWFDCYEKMSAKCKDALALLVYQSFFKVFLLSIMDLRFKKFHPQLFKIYNSLSEKLNLPIIEKPEEFSVVRAKSIGLLKSILVICECRQKQPCYQIMYHECSRFVKKQRLFENIKPKVSEQVWLQASVWIIIYASKKCEIRIGSKLYNRLSNSCSGRDSEHVIKVFLLSDFLAEEVLQRIDHNKNYVKQMKTGKKVEQKEYIFNYLNEYFKYLCEAKFPVNSDVTFGQIKSMQWYQLKTYMEYIRKTTGSCNQQHFFKIVDDKLKLQLRIKWRLYEWFDSKADKFFAKDKNKTKIKKEVLQRVNELVPDITRKLAKKNHRTSISDDVIKRIVLKNIMAEYVQEYKDKFIAIKRYYTIFKSFGAGNHKMCVESKGRIKSLLTGVIIDKKLVDQEIMRIVKELFGENVLVKKVFGGTHIELCVDDVQKNTTSKKEKKKRKKKLSKKEIEVLMDENTPEEDDDNNLSEIKKDIRGVNI